MFVMENGYNNRARSSICGQWFNRRFRTWFVIISSLQFVKCGLALKCLDVEMTVATFPEGNINIPYGSPLEIYCTTDNGTSEHLEFQISKRRINSSIVNETTIKYYDPFPPKQNYKYYCVNTESRKNCLNDVLVETPPANVTDFQCISYNLDSLNCSWTSPKSFSNIDYNLTYFLNGAPVMDCKVQRLENSRRFCILNADTIPSYKQYLEYYEFQLTSKNTFGQIEQNITVDHYAFVTPEEPLGLNCSNEKPHSATLEWNISNNLVDYLKCGLDHRIEYQIGISQGDNITYFHQVNTSSLPPRNKTYRFELTNLPYAHMRYDVRVYIKSKKASDKYWSKYGYVIVKTASERPHRPPEIPPGAFAIKSFINYRNIHIYWKQLEEYEECGDHFTYLIHIKQQKRTLQPDKNNSMSYVFLSNASIDALDVFVQSYNSNGTSVDSSHLFIPQQSQLLEGPTSFTKLAYSNGTYELSWDIQNMRIDNYTLFWCRYNLTEICVGKIYYTMLKHNKINHVLNLPTDQRYEFAISVNRGKQTSGMIWAKCDISKDAANYDIPVRLDHGTPVNSSVVIMWDLRCTLRDGIIMGYNITYCPIKDTSNLCDETVGNISISISDPDAKSINITGLLYHRTYKFDFYLITVNGPMAIKDATTSVTTPEGIPTSPVNVTVSNITNDSVVISYNPPKQKNGNVVYYHIFNYNNKVYTRLQTDAVELPNSENVRRNVTISDLQSYSNYSWIVQACNTNNFCSKLNENDVISMRTSFGPPRKLKPYIISYDSDVLGWLPPPESDKIDHVYEILKIKNGEELRPTSTKENFTFIAACNGVDGVVGYKVRAVYFVKDPYFGARGGKNVILPIRDNSTLLTYKGEWSDEVTSRCRGSGFLAVILIVILFVLSLAIYGFIKFHHYVWKMKDIEPILPPGLSIPEKEITNKHKFNGWNPLRKNEAPSEEKSLLPNTKTVIPPPEVKPNEENSGNSDRTDSTMISDTSKGSEQDASTSDEGSACSVEAEHLKPDSQIHSGLAVLPNAPAKPSIITDGFKKNPDNGYVQHGGNPAVGGMGMNHVPFEREPLEDSTQPTTSRYVMAGFDPPISNVTVAPPAPKPVSNSAYVRHEEFQPKMFINLPILGTSPTKPFGQDSLPALAHLSPLSKQDAGSYPLQSLESLPKPTIRNMPQIKPASTGYVTAENPVINKHLNIVSGNNQGMDDPAILDPNLSADAYCRFSWNPNPANDNLSSLHVDSPTTDPSHN